MGDTSISKKKCMIRESSAYIETQLERETMNAVPTPRFDVGAKALAAQLLWLQFSELPTLQRRGKREKTYMTSGNKL
jgi:hypothetical protein